jgi:hypothetical protein
MILCNNKNMGFNFEKHEISEYQYDIPDMEETIHTMRTEEAPESANKAFAHLLEQVPGLELTSEIESGILDGSHTDIDESRALLYFGILGQDNMSVKVAYEDSQDQGPTIHFVKKWSTERGSENIGISLDYSPDGKFLGGSLSTDKSNEEFDTEGKSATRKIDIPKHLKLITNIDTLNGPELFSGSEMI